MFAILRKRTRVNPVASFHTGEIFMPGAGINVYDPIFAPCPAQDLLGAARNAGFAPAPFSAPIVITNPARIISGMPRQLGTFDHTGLEGG